MTDATSDEREIDILKTYLTDDAFKLSQLEASLKETQRELYETKLKLDYEKSSHGNAFEQWHLCLEQLKNERERANILIDALKYYSIYRHDVNESTDPAINALVKYHATEEGKSDGEIHNNINVAGYAISYCSHGGYWIQGPECDGMQTTTAFEKLIADFFKENM